jgi:hypothetical protein
MNMPRQGWPAAPAVGGAAENEGSYGAHRQRQEDGKRDVRNIGLEFRSNIFQHEHQKKKIESVQ